MASTAPIGVFDSGLGGISVAHEIRRAMPHERVLYFGDSANAPYGTKTLRERKFAALMDRFKADHTIHPEPCPDLVSIVESGRLDDHDLVMRTLHGYFDHYDLDSIDAVVLGCTHFVFYRGYFRELLPDSAAIIDGNEGTVRHLHVVLESLGKLAPEDAVGGVELANSDPSPHVAALAQDLLQRP